MIKEARIKLDPPTVGRMVSGHIVLDGMDLSRGVTALELRAGVRERPTLLLEVPIAEVEIEGSVQVVIPAATHDALVALGWTPPAGQP